MTTVSITYEGDLHCRAVHGPSGSTLVTDAPADNQGKGEHFSPTDLVATALGTCILTVIAMKAESLGLDLSGAAVVVDKQMLSGPRRIGRLATTVTIPRRISAREQKLLEAAAHTCPVHKSMSAEVEMPIAFNWA
jgi:putative redox protein